MLRKSILIYLSLVVAAAISAAQQVQPANPLLPPKGYKVALVEFEDLECPDCANAAPILKEAVKAYHIPLVRYDFPLTKHPWAHQAAVMARYLDTRSKKLGDEFRDYCFAHQPYPGKEQPWIQTPEDLRAAAEKFASAHGFALPLVIDPQGKLEAKVNEGLEAGQEVGINHTPTIYVVTNQSAGKPFVEVVDRSNLFSQIDEMIAEAGGITDKPAAHKRTMARK